MVLEGSAQHQTKHVRRGPRILSDEDTEEFMAYHKQVIQKRRQEQQEEELDSEYDLMKVEERIANDPLGHP